MTRNRETKFDWCRFGRHWRAATVIALLSPLLVGCDPQMVDDSDVIALEASWPPYRAPTVDTQAALNPWASSSPKSFRRRQRPELDTPMPVIRSYRNWDLEETALDSLARIGAPAVPELIKALKNNDPRVRYQAAQVLGRIGPDAEAAVTALVRAIDDPEPQVQKAATRSIGQIRSESGEAIRALMRVINEASDRPPAIPARP